MRMEEQHRRDFQELRSEVNVLDDRLSKEEFEMSALELRVTHLEREHTTFQGHQAGVQLHAEDLENQSRRIHLHIWGLPEATGPENLQDTIQVILLRVLDTDAPTSLEFDRVHRALGFKLTEQD